MTAMETESKTVLYDSYKGSKEGNAMCQLWRQQGRPCYMIATETARKTMVYIYNQTARKTMLYDSYRDSKEDNIYNKK